jgi:polar amino acid transport system substrate-binding protein
MPTNLLRSSSTVRLTRACGAVALGLALAWASAQPPELPATWFPNRAPSVAGQGIPLCVDAREPSHEVDAAIAIAIGDALLITIDLIDVDRTVVVETEFEDLYVDLVDRCTAYLGFKLYPGTYPDWLTFTRPFYEARFVLLGRADAPARLDDLPAGTAIGVMQGTLGDVRFINHNRARGSGAQWRRIPLGTPQANLDALVEERVDAVLVWEPWWWALARTDARYAGLQVIDAPVVSDPWIGVGAALTGDRTYARNELDAALAALTDDGSIATILEGFDAFPGRVAVGR